MSNVISSSKPRNQISNQITQTSFTFVPQSVSEDSLKMIKEVKKKSKQKLCFHNKRKTVCKHCGGASLCEHSKRKIDCRECNPSNFCSHGKRKRSCKECKSAKPSPM